MISRVGIRRLAIRCAGRGALVASGSPCWAAQFIDSLPPRMQFSGHEKVRVAVVRREDDVARLKEWTGNCRAVDPSPRREIAGKWLRGSKSLAGKSLGT